MSMFIKMKEVAEILGVSETTVHRMVKTGIMPSVRFYGRNRKILRDQFYAWLDRIVKESNDNSANGGNHVLRPTTEV